jgi:TolB-like protein/DNA-binding winged helix-turn-helix (wHTH) protein
MNETGVHPAYVFDGFRLDAQPRVLSRANSEPIPLAPKVFDTLLYFVERPGQLIAKRELLEAIWPHVVVEENNLTQAISALRRVLGETPGAHRFIVTEPGRGYRFVASVRTIPRLPDELPAAPKAPAPPSDADTPAVRLPVGSSLSHYAVAAALTVMMLGGAWVWMSDREVPSASVSANTSTPGASSVQAVLPNSVAVLPLANLGPDPDQAAYADGMHAEIIHQLSKLHNVNVIAREAVVQNVANRSPAERARDLHVQSILTGTFQFVDGRIRVNMQLVDPTSNSILWAQDYEERFEDVFAVQADIARRVAAALGAELTAAERLRMETRPTTSGEAYAVYLLALAASIAKRCRWPSEFSSSIRTRRLSTRSTTFGSHMCIPATSMRLWPFSKKHWPSSPRRCPRVSTSAESTHAAGTPRRPHARFAESRNSRKAVAPRI